MVVVVAAVVVVVVVVGDLDVELFPPPFSLDAHVSLYAGLHTDNPDPTVSSAAFDAEFEHVTLSAFGNAYTDLKPKISKLFRVTVRPLPKKTGLQGLFTPRCLSGSSTVFSQ